MFGTCNQDYYEFVEAVFDSLNSKVTIKISMDDPSVKAKQLKQVFFFFFGLLDFDHYLTAFHLQERAMEENLTLTFGDNVERGKLERMCARQLLNVSP